jgi:hypothetical protein
MPHGLIDDPSSVHMNYGQIVPFFEITNNILSQQAASLKTFQSP